MEAVYLMEEAAKKGYPRAAFAMAQMFEYGWAVHQSKSRSLEWYKKAADMGDAYAISYLEKIRRKKK
ncbi:MAG: SEL1-like repeat protein [Clostridia bacterium]|nr:SEL1-like repeat protein [Clostridia bacterium]